MEIVFIGSIFLLLAVGAFAGYCFELGDGKRDKNFQQPMPGREGEIDPELERIQRILDNVDAYVGTNRGQKEVE